MYHKYVIGLYINKLPQMHTHAHTHMSPSHDMYVPIHIMANYSSGRYVLVVKVIYSRNHKRECNVIKLTLNYTHTT